MSESSRAAVKKQESNAVLRSAPIPIYKQISENLKKRISEEEFANGSKLPSTRELALYYKVNHLTLRQALKTLQQEGVIDITHGRGSFLGGTSDGAAMKTVLVLPNVGHEQSGIISQGVRSELGSNAIINLMDYHQNVEEEVACLNRIRSERFNSAIVYPSMRGEAVRSILQLIVEGFPIVLVDRAFTNIPSAYVISDNRMGGYLATQHLLNKGCRRIACFTNNLPSVSERFSGYLLALAERGVCFEKELVVTLPLEGDVEENATQKLLESHKAPDGIFYLNDYEALKGMKQLRKAGLSIPDDVRVVGFDDHTLAKYSDPPLTSIRQNNEQIGREAAKLLNTLIKLPAHDRFAMRKIVTPVELVVRESA